MDNCKIADAEMIMLILKYFGAGLVLALTYLAGYRDCKKEREDEE